ncbi:GreA/GreB family elongation factor [soil metagenome]
MNPDLEKLIASGRLPAAAAKTLSHFEPGAFCFHKSWGTGQIASWDALGGSVIIDFDGKPGHPMKMEFAAKSLEPLPDDHILARRHADPASLKALAEEKPEELVAQTLKCFGGSMYLDNFDDIIKGKIIPEGKYKSWWDAAKRKLRTDRRFVVPPKRTEPLQMRGGEESVADILVADFTEARDLKSKVRAADAILKDIGAFELPEEQLRPVIEDIDTNVAKAIKLHPVQVVELVLARQDLLAQIPELEPAGGEGEEGLTLVAALRLLQDRMEQLVASLPVASQRKLYEVLPEAFEENWTEIALQQINNAGSRGIGELSKFLVSSDRQDALEAYLKTAIQHRTISADLLVWICKEREGAASGLFDEELAACIIQVLERDYYDEEASRNNRLHDLLLNDRTLVTDLMAHCDKHQVKNFSRRLLGSPVFEELNRRSLLARIIKTYPEVGELVSGDEKQEDHRIIVSWKSLEERKRAFDKLNQSDIPENIKEIQVAREHGDLRENAEYKAAKEKQVVLNRMKTEMEKELGNARGTDFANVDATRVNVGTTVDFQDATSGEKETFSILGAWDTNLNRGIISYLSGTGAALLGAKVGDTVELPSEAGAGSTRKIEVLAIRPWVDADADADAEADADADADADA